MKTLAFYSFKGGVGRSLSLLNLAFILSNKYGKRVGLVDLDVESSGLHHILGLQVNTERDLLHLLLPENRNITRFEKYIYQVPKLGKKNSNVFLIPTLNNPQLLDQFKWDENIYIFLREELFPAFNKVYGLDYLFIDGRTGLSKFSAFALAESNLVLLFCRLDRQNEFGISRMVKVCKAASKPILTIVSSCPIIKNLKSIISTFETKIDAEINFVLPYLSELYFNEFIVCIEKPKSSLANAYESLASKILEIGLNDEQ